VGSIRKRSILLSVAIIEEGLATAFSEDTVCRIYQRTGMTEGAHGTAPEVNVIYAENGRGKTTLTPISKASPRCGKIWGKSEVVAMTGDQV
jgi:hypothetical protein